MPVKKAILKIVPIIVLLIVISLYGGGILSQIKAVPSNSWEPQLPGNTQKISYNISDCIKIGISKGKKQSMAVAASCTAVIIILALKGSSKTSEKDERGFNRSQKGTYGTSGWMTREEVRENFELKPATQTDGTILGEYEGEVISTPVKSKHNKHVSVYGASGTGKSRCFVRSHIIQSVKRGESLIITDPKGELYADAATYLKNNGYNVKVFNLVSLQNSDSWACLDEITAVEDEVELMAQTFCDVIIKNTMEGGKGDHFWDNAEMNLLKALCLYVVMSDDDLIPRSGKTIGTVYGLLTSKTEEQLTTMFDSLPISHPARKPWTIFKKASESVRGNVIIGLGSRLQVFQADNIRKITSTPEIDLEAPGKEKCAYFVIMSDQNSTLDFLSSLFFSFLFIRLVKYADVHGKDGKLDVPVNFVLDEFPNIGQIPDFTKKLSTIRSRELRVVVIFQNIAQLQNRYPNGLWEEIIGNCDTQLFLGCTDQMTAEFVSKRSGEMSIEVSSNSRKKDTLALLQSTPSYQESTSVGKRTVLTPDEVLRLRPDEALIILRGQKVVKIKKFDYSKHPDSVKFIYSPIRDHIPQWRKPIVDAESASPIEVNKTEIDASDLDSAFSASEDVKTTPKQKIQSPSNVTDSVESPQHEKKEIKSINNNQIKARHRNGVYDRATPTPKLKSSKEDSPPKQTSLVSGSQSIDISEKNIMECAPPDDF